jgi:hypothetical protein
VPRTFVGANSEIVTHSAGALGTTISAFSFAFLVRLSGDFSASRQIFRARNASNGGVFSATVGTAARMSVFSGPSTSLQSSFTVSGSEWSLLVASRSAGASTNLDMGMFRFATGAWTWETPGVLNDAADTPNNVDIGRHFTTTTQAFDGDIAVGAIWLRRLTTADFEALPYSLAAWQSRQPSAFWVFDQASTSQQSLDRTGGGANQTAITGTSVSSASLPILGYGHPVVLATHNPASTFYTDSDRSGAGEFLEAEVSLATEFTVPAGKIHRFRWPFPALSPSVTPQIRLYDASGTLVAGPFSFDSTTLSSWNWATPSSPISVSAGTYRATVNTTRYPAKSGFFSSGSVIRGSVTAVQGRFGSGVVAPTSTSANSYLVDIEFAAADGAVTHDATATLAATGSLTATATKAIDGTATLAATGTLTAAGVRAQAATATLSATGALTAAATVDRAATATLAATGALSAAGERTAVTSGTLSATGTLTAAATATRDATAVLVAVGALSAAGDVTTPGVETATLTGTGALTATAARTAVDTSLLAAVGALTATASRSTSGTATLAAVGALTATAVVVPPAGATSAPTSALATATRPGQLATTTRPPTLSTGTPPT